MTGVAQAGHDISDVRALLVIRFRADHDGLAGRVRQASGGVGPEACQQHAPW